MHALSSRVSLTLLNLSYQSLFGTKTEEKSADSSNGNNTSSSSPSPLFSHLLPFAPAKSQNPPNVIIVTADTRPLPTVGSFESFLSIFAVALQYYAHIHNYTVVRYIYETDTYRNTCKHPMHGSRHASWCKLLAVRRVMMHSPANSIIVWMDSDAAIANVNQSVPDIIAAAGTGRVRHACRSPACERFKHAACLLTTANYPAESENAMASVFFLRSSQCSLTTLRWWWNVGICGNEFPWEQRALNSILYPASYMFKDVRVSQLAIGPNYRAPGQPLEHFGHTHVPSERLSLSLACLTKVFHGKLPSPEAFELWHSKAQAAQVWFNKTDLVDVGIELAGVNLNSGLELASYLDAERAKKLLAKECFYMGFHPTTP